MTRSVAVDEEVYVLLVTRAESAGQTANDVLRELLEAPTLPSPTSVLPDRPAAIGDLKPLLTVGLVAAGDELVYEQPMKRLVHRGTVTADGCVIAGGEVFQKVSPALKRLVGHEASGWAHWTHVRSGRLLMDLRDDLRRRPAGPAQAPRRPLGTGSAPAVGVLKDSDGVVSALTVARAMAVADRRERLRRDHHAPLARPST